MSASTELTRHRVNLWGGRVPMWVQVKGRSGPDLLYLHPAGGLTWDPFLDWLADRHTVFAPEFPGSSTGYADAGENITALRDMVLVYEELTRRLDLTAPVVVGQSFGGMIAAELASTYPDLPAKLVLLDPVGLWREERPMTNWLEVPPEEMPGVLFHDLGAPQVKAFQARPQEASSGTDKAQSFAASGRYVWPNPDKGLRQRLRRVSCPTLLVWGEEDRLVPAAYLDDFLTLIPGSIGTLIEGCGHIPQVEAVGTTMAAVERFLR